MTFEITGTQLLLLLLPFIIIGVGIKKRIGMLSALGGLFLVFLSFFLGIPFWFGTILVFMGFLFVFTGVFL